MYQIEKNEPVSRFLSSKTFYSGAKEMNTQSVLKNFKTTIKLMEQYLVLPTPENYKIFYIFAENNTDNETNKRIIEQIDDAIKNQTLNENFLLKIYNSYFLNNEYLNKIIQDTCSHISTTEQSLSLLKEKYQSHSNKVEIFITNDNLELKNILKEILVQHTDTIKTLQDSNREIEKLKKEIESLKQETYIDPLTEIYNRRKLYMELQNKIKNYKTFFPKNPKNPKIYLVMMDIDNFKQINDTFNHRVGDSVLKYVSKKVISSINKQQDIFARYGGEEFALVLVADSDKSALHTLKTIKQNVSNTTLKVSGTNQKIGNITLSYGATQYQPSESIDEFIERADNLMYKAKKTGKNRIIFLESQTNRIITIR